MRCHTCRADLITMNAEGVVSYACPVCRGAAITNAHLRRVAPRKRFVALWRKVREATTRGGPGCPTCRKSMHVVTADVEGHAPVTLDGCPSCQLIWFDANELERFSPESQTLRPLEAPAPRPRFIPDNYHRMLETNRANLAGRHAGMGDPGLALFAIVEAL